MQTAQPSVFARDHTMFGVCEALGEDLGFSPVFLRIALGVGLFFSPGGALAVYVGLGMLVAFTRFVAPVPREPAAPEAEAGRAEAARTQPEPDLALAA
ncbi:MAG TPA: PspC domain-containing protein [Allosphingosinicella sp.]|jgi:phage shock protein PspC (stress-responsive transcriptional regulator)